MFLKLFFLYLQLPKNKKSKAYDHKKYNKKWELAIWEANVLQCIKLPHRIQFYDKILMECVNKLGLELRNSLKLENRCDTPQTFDTAYSSMKQSVSPASLSPTLNELDRNYDVDKNINNYLKSVEDSSLDELPVEDFQMDDDASFARMTESPSSSGQFICPLYKLINDKLQDDKINAFNGYFCDENMFVSNLNELWSEMKKSTTKSSKVSLGKRKSRTLSADSAISATTVGTSFQSSRQRKLAEKKAAEAQAKKDSPEMPYPEMIKPTKEQRQLEKQKKAEEKLLKFCVINHPSNFILKGLPKDPVCSCCLGSGAVMKCAGKCTGFYHKDCFGKHVNESEYNAILKKKIKKDSKKQLDETEKTDPVCSIEENVSKLRCQSCITSQPTKCLICSKTDGDLVPCCEKNCGKSYHIECLKYWPQHKKIYAGDKVKSLSCSRHVCHTCVSPDIRNMFHSMESDKKLIKCLLCPGTYHRSSECIPAGSELLSETQLICARHQPNLFDKNVKRINIDYCLFCSEGGKLICCDACAYSFHPECLKVSVGDNFNCEVRSKFSVIILH